MDRCWLLTWTTYGTWLPGDVRGFVGPIDDSKGGYVVHNQPGSPYDADIVHLQGYTQTMLKCPPIYLTKEQATTLASQFRETADKRNWQLIAFAVMPTHVHIVVGVLGDPAPSSILRDFKSYASKKLNSSWSKPKSDTWWTESGSKRKLPDESAILAAVRYVMEQSNALIIWVADKYRDLIELGERPGERPA